LQGIIIELLQTDDKAEMSSALKLNQS